jgi:anti-sigma factor RsiW
MTGHHASFEQLGDFADGSLGASEAETVARHVGSCAECAADLARLRALLDRATTLSRELEPPAEAWLALRDSLGPRSRRAPVAARPWIRGWMLRAAAAMVLIAGSSALTVLALRSRFGEPVPNAPPPTVMARAAAPAVVRAVDQSYIGVVEELTATLRAQRRSLAPATVATLERTLRVIDDAIAEARDALAADPGNSALLDILSANYEQKVELLRRASELLART